MSAPAIYSGFANPVLDSQSVFRAALECMAQPGKTERLEPSGFSPPPALPLAAAALALALADYDTPIFLGPSVNHADVRAWLSFHAGAPLAQDPAAATFVILGAADFPSLTALAVGDDRYPDKSATLVLLCDSLEGGEVVTLNGPGIRDEERISPAGVSASLWADLAANAELYPLGFDTFVVSGADILALPRSTRLNLNGIA